MPKIVQYNPDQVQTQIAQQPMARSAPAAAFGGDVAKGLSDVAKATFDMKKRIDTTSAEEAMVKFERAKNDTFFNPDNGYFNTQGRDAYDNSVNTTKAIEELKKKHGDALNPDARFMFDRVANKHITSANTDIARHAAKGLKVWEVSTIEAQVENTIENSSLYWNDPDKLRVQSIIGEQAIVDAAELSGISPEATAEKLQTYRSAVAGATIAAATQSSAAEGKIALDKYGTKLEGPDAVKVKAAIERKAKVEKTQADANAAVLTAGKLNNQYDTRQDIIDEVNKIKDPELRKKTMSESMTQFSASKVAAKEEQNNYYQDAIKSVNDGLTPMQIQARNAEAWEGMSDSQRNNILSGKHMITDQVVLNKFRMMGVKEKAEFDPNSISDKLNPRDMQKVVSEVQAARKGNQGSRVKTLSAKAMQAAESAFGKKKKWTSNSGKANDKGKAANQFLSDLQDAIDEAETDKGGKITPAEENQIISEFTRQIVVERSNFGLDILAFDTEIDLSNAPAKDVRMLNQIIDKTPDIDMVDLTEAYQFLIDEGQPVTATTLRKVYAQGRK